MAGNRIFWFGATCFTGGEVLRSANLSGFWGTITPIAFGLLMNQISIRIEKR